MDREQERCAPRRAFLGGLAALPLASAGAAEAEGRPDPAIEAVAAVLRADKAWDAADGAWSSACGRYSRPPLPAAAEERPGDLMQIGFRTVRDLDRGGSWHEPEHLPHFRTFATSRSASPGARARCLELADALEAWTEEDQRRRAAAGLDEAEAAFSRAGDAFREAADSLIAVQATSVPGLIAKARAVQVMRGGEPIDFEGNDTPDEQTALSIVRDLLALGQDA